jgi:hypothetical protein
VSLLSTVSGGQDASRGADEGADDALPPELLTSREVVPTTATQSRPSSAKAHRFDWSLGLLAGADVRTPGPDIVAVNVEIVVTECNSLPLVFELDIN